MKVATIINVIASVVTIIAFAGITPEMIGDTLYGIWYYAAPILSWIFGIAVGWNAHKWYLDKEGKKKETNQKKEQSPHEGPNAVKGIDNSNFAFGVFSNLTDLHKKTLKTLCGACIVDDDLNPSRPLILSSRNSDLKAINLCIEDIYSLEEAGVLRIYEEDNRKIVVTNAATTTYEIEQGIRISNKETNLHLPDGWCKFGRARLNWGTDAIVAKGLYGADLGFVEFTDAGKEIAKHFKTKELSGLRKYIEDLYSEGIKISKFRCSFVDEIGVAEQTNK